MLAFIINNMKYILITMIITIFHLHYDHLIVTHVIDDVIIIPFIIIIISY